MFGGFRRKPSPRPQVEFVTPPPEPDPDVERRIRELDERIYIAHRCGLPDRVDELLGRRNRIRPPRPAPVPVVPGGSS